MFLLILGSCATGFVAGKLLDGGLTDLFCVQSLRHGTNLFSYMKIRTFGADPSLGGHKIGSTYGNQIDHDVVNHFYTMKDKEFAGLLTEEDMLASKKLTNYDRAFKIFSDSLKWVAPRHHSYLSGYNTILHVLHLDSKPDLDSKPILDSKSDLDPQVDLVSKSKSEPFINKIIGTFGGLMTLLTTPIVKVRICDTTDFKNDPEYGEMAYKTSKAIAPWRMGLLGTFVSGINLDLAHRIRSDPKKFFSGFIQLAIAAAFIYAMLPTLRSYYTRDPGVFLASCTLGFLLA